MDVGRFVSYVIIAGAAGLMAAAWWFGRGKK